ncbi:hypothetical protein LguiB_013570 [Lonicera macranthoides]
MHSYGAEISITYILLSSYYPLESILQMDSKLYSAAITGNIQLLGQNKDQIGVQLTQDKKTVLHVASQLGHTEAVKVILSMKPLLISEVNLSGETALHLAARGGHACVVRVLIDCARKSDDDLESKPRLWQLILWAENDDGETALHEAVRFNRCEVLSMLVKEDSIFKHSANKMGETPLYIAASRGFAQLVDVILNNCNAPAYSGPNGTTALHGAIGCGSGECARKLSEWKKTMVKETDSNGRTPLHYAAYFGFSSIASQLLCLEPSTAYIVAKDYSETALHIAAIRGHISVMKEILLACPDSCSMVDIYGRNMLHLAIENNQKKVVEHIIEECPVISSLINQKDVEGNSPSHLMALSNCNVTKLIQHDMVDKGALNNHKLTDLGSLYKNIRNIKTEVIDGVNPMWTLQPIGKEGHGDLNQCRTHIQEAAKCYGGSLYVHNTTNQEATMLTNKEEAYPALLSSPVAAPVPAAAPAHDPTEVYRKYINNDIIVAALIVTIAFAAGFSMPGGYIQSGSENQGMAVLTKSLAFQAFIISDTLALVFSIIALLLYGFTAGNIKQDTVTKFYFVGGCLVLLALVAIMIAFITGTYAIASMKTHGRDLQHSSKKLSNATKDIPGDL